VTGRQSNIIKIETGNIGVNLTSEKYCSSHKEEVLQMFCLTCDAAICVTCVCESHKKHSTITLVKKLQVSRKTLQFDLDQLQIEIKDVKSALTKLHDIEKEGDKSADDAVTLIKDQTISMVKKLEALAEMKIEKVKADRVKHLKEIQDYEKELSTHLQQLQKGAQFLGDLQEEDMCLELITCFQKFRTILETGENSIANKAVAQNHFSYVPGKVWEKFGNILLCRSRLENREVEHVLMKKDVLKRASLFKRLRSKLSISGLLLVLMSVCLLAGFYQIGEQIMASWKDGEISCDLLMGAGLYTYLCLAGLCAYLKARKS